MSRDLSAHLFADFERVPEVYAAPDADQSLFFGHLPDAADLSLPTRVYGIGGGERRNRPGAEHGFEDARRGTALDGRLRRVLRMHWRDVQGRPAGVSFCGIVAVFVSIA